MPTLNYPLKLTTLSYFLGVGHISIKRTSLLFTFEHMYSLSYNHLKNQNRTSRHFLIPPYHATPQIQLIEYTPHTPSNLMNGYFDYKSTIFFLMYQYNSPNITHVFHVLPLSENRSVNTENMSFLYRKNKHRFNQGYLNHHLDYNLIFLDRSIK